MYTEKPSPGLRALRYGDRAVNEPAVRALSDLVTGNAAQALGGGTAGAQALQCKSGERVVNYEWEFIPEIPKIMRNRGWTLAADFQDFWISGAANQLVGEQKRGQGTARNIEFADIKMDWVLNFSRAQKHFEMMASEQIYANEAARKVLRDLVLKLHKQSGKPQVAFGDFTKKYLALEDEYVNQRALGTSQGGKGSLYSTDGFTVDELVGALGRFAMFVIPKGIAEIKQSEIEFEINEVGVYVRDSYDFNGSQALGAWRKPNEIDIIPNAQAKVPTCSDDWFNMSNYHYRQYRKRTGKGRDFLIYSDIKTSPAKTAFTMRKTS